MRLFNVNIKCNTKFLMKHLWWYGIQSKCTLTKQIWQKETLEKKVHTFHAIPLQ